VHQTTAVALTPASVCLIRRRDALHLMQEAPEVHQALVGRCLAAMDEAQAGLLQNAALSNRDRLCLFLDRLARAAVPGVADPLPGGGVRLMLPMPRTDLAGMLGVQPETLSRLLARLRAEGVVRLVGRAIEVPGPARLAVAAA
jgi:CRP-like cAMP-binding protein